MRRLTTALLAIAIGLLAAANTASAATTQDLRAQFHGSPSDCPPGTDTCGKGVVNGVGTVTTSLAFTGAAPGPGDCVTATAIRFVELDSDGSTLVLSLAGTICGNKIDGTFAILGGTGVFAGASGGGTAWGTAIPGQPSDTIHLRGTITLP